MREDRDHFEPVRLKRAVKRLDYLKRWIDEEFRPKREIKSMDTLESSHKRGFLAKLLSMLKSEPRV